MCGIAGFLDTGGTPIVRHDSIRSMCLAMSHRGPDAEGLHFDGPVALGHRRLSIIDLSDASNQPLTDPSGRYVTVFNGEMYNYRDVREQLAETAFRTNSDTEVLLAAYAKWGPDCVHRFKGMFAFAIWDSQERSLFLCRDRMGVKPLYLHLGEGFLMFASEVRALMASGLLPRRIDRQALPDYLAFQSFGYPSSPVTGIEQLEAGSWMHIKGKEVRKEVYWKPGATRVEGDLEDPAFVRRSIRELLLQSVERRLVSDVPIGAFLSGGIDSSSVVGLMAEAGFIKPSTFNVSFAEEEFDESRYANAIARKFDTKHTTIRLAPEDFLKDLEEALDAMDSPSGDGPNTYMVSRAVKRAGITVALSGVGGDELFAGYPFFLTQLRLQKLGGPYRLTGGIRRAAASLLQGSASGRMQRMASIFAASGTEICHTYPEYRRIITRRQTRALTRLGENHPYGLERQLLDRRSEMEALPVLSQVSVAEYMGYTQHTLLKDTDQMSMAVSLEVREPFFDHDLVDFVLQVPDAVKRPRYPKSLLVESLAPLLPDEIVHRKKQGFVFPWDLWMRGPLRDFCEKRIEALCDRDFIRADALRAFWKEFLENGSRIRYTDLWVFVVLGYWMERNRVE
jgi:asparagine synthase (glutamine-hydrolysing)